MGSKCSCTRQSDECVQDMPTGLEKLKRKEVMAEK